MYKLFNFDNIGGKIKNLAKYGCWITILLIWIAALITFLILVIDEWMIEFCWIPIVSAVAGPLVIWVGSWVIYAFGEYVEDVHAIRTKYYPQSEEIEKLKAEEKTKREALIQAQKSKHELKIKSQKYECPKCKHTIHYGDDVCKKCGRKLDWSKVQEQIK